MKLSNGCPGTLQMWYHVVSATVVKTESQGMAISPWVVGVKVSVTMAKRPGWQPIIDHTVSPGNSVSTCISKKMSAIETFW